MVRSRGIRAPRTVREEDKLLYAINEWIGGLIDVQTYYSDTIMDLVGDLRKTRMLLQDMMRLYRSKIGGRIEE